MKSRGCLIAVAAAFAVVLLAGVLLGPTLLREGARLYVPIAKMKGAQTDFETWSEAHKFVVPPGAKVTEEQIDRFLKLRRRLAGVDEANPMPIEGMRRKERPSLSEIEGLLEGVGGAVTGRMEAYREADMTPDEYRYIEKVVYRMWLRPLRSQGLDPATVSRAAREVMAAAATEKDATVAARLKTVARAMSERRIDPPEGIPGELHALLMARATEIDALIDSGGSMPMRGGRSGVDF